VEFLTPRSKTAGPEKAWQGASQITKRHVPSSPGTRGHASETGKICQLPEETRNWGGLGPAQG